MKRLLTTFFSLLFTIGLFAQAKKPILMVVPGDNWMYANHYMSTYRDMSGNSKQYPDYKQAFLANRDLSKVISAMEGFMTEEGYEVVSLEDALNTNDQQEAISNVDNAGGGVDLDPLDVLMSTVTCDIKVKLDFEIKRDGPYKFVEFDVKAVDAYNNKPVSANNIGRGTSGSSTQLVNQLQEAVLSFKDKFISDMDRYYAGLFNNGRQIMVRCYKAENSPIDFSTEFDDEELSDLIEEFITDNALKGNASTNGAATAKRIEFRVQIPMTYTNQNGKVKGTDAKWFGNKVKSFIKSKTKVNCSVIKEGIGGVRLTIGGKE